MAITRTLAELAGDLRIGDGITEPTGPQAIVLQRIAATAAMVVGFAPGAPDAIHDEAFVRLAGWLYDADPSGSTPGGPSALRSSGAASLLSRYKIRRGGVIGGEIDAAVAAASPGNPVVDVTIFGSVLTVSYADGSTQDRQLPEGGDGGGEGDGTDLYGGSFGPWTIGGSGGLPSPIPVGTALYTDSVGGGQFSGQPRIRFYQEAASGLNYLIPGDVLRFIGDTTFEVTVLGSVYSSVADTTPEVYLTATIDQRGIYSLVIVRGGVQTPIPPSALTDTPPDAADLVPVTTQNGRAFRFVETSTFAGGGDDAYDWATQDDVSRIPTAKLNVEGLQSQIDRLADEFGHTTGPITSVVPVLGAGNDSLRYTIASETVGNFDISVTVTARVQLNELVNFSGTLRISEDGSGGLNDIILPSHHNYPDHHEAVLTFVRRGVEIPAGVKAITFMALVTGNNPPGVHLISQENLKLTPTALVNRNNVGAFVQDWAEEGNDDVVPYGKLRHNGQGVREWALDSADDETVPTAPDLGTFDQDDVDAIPLEGSKDFILTATVLKDADGTLAFITRGWETPAPGGGGGPTFVGVVENTDQSWIEVGDVSAFDSILVRGWGQFAGSTPNVGLQTSVVRKTWLPTSDTATAPAGGFTGGSWVVVERAGSTPSDVFVYLSVVAGRLRFSWGGSLTSARIAAWGW